VGATATAIIDDSIITDADPLMSLDDELRRLTVRAFADGDATRWFFSFPVS
jgi:hypothetical protein